MAMDSGCFKPVTMLGSFAPSDSGAHAAARATTRPARYDFMGIGSLLMLRVEENAEGYVAAANRPSRKNSMSCLINSHVCLESILFRCFHLFHRGQRLVFS
jgi:hypothetical protein